MVSSDGAPSSVRALGSADRGRSAVTRRDRERHVHRSDRSSDDHVAAGGTASDRQWADCDGRPQSCRSRVAEVQMRSVRVQASPFRHETIVCGSQGAFSALRASSLGGRFERRHCLSAGSRVRESAAYRSSVRVAANTDRGPPPPTKTAGESRSRRSGSCRSHPSAGRPTGGPAALGSAPALGLLLNRAAFRGPSRPAAGSLLPGPPRARRRGP